MSDSPLIFIVDDDDDCREVLEYLLVLEGFRVASATDGTDALRQLRAGLMPCLILLDLRMPRVDGWEFRRQQADDARLAAIPTVVMSGDGGHPAIPGVVADLEKPVDVDRLRLIIDAHCRHAAP